MNLPDISRAPEPTFHDTDPVTFYNLQLSTDPERVLADKNWSRNGKPGRWTKGEAVLDQIDGHYYCIAGGEALREDQDYTPFQILTLVGFAGNWMAAANWVNLQYRTEQVPFVRIGCDYFKQVEKIDRYGVRTIELKTWKKDEIKQDYGQRMLNVIPRFDDFCLVPDNFDYQQVVDNCYNLYSPFRHKPMPGSTLWSERMMAHVFGDQEPLGWRYMKALYMNPDRMLPVLVLVSKERQTGKTTFLNWLNMIFGNNMAMVSPDDIMADFNDTIARSNIIAIEETIIEKGVTVEKIKSLSTGKWITVNAKWISKYKLPFFGKIIMTSNNEAKFARIDDEEIRFFIRKLSAPTWGNHDIEADLLQEIPAMLYRLQQMPAVDWSVSRMGFTKEELDNEQLRTVKAESRSWMFKELQMMIADFFMTTAKLSFYATALDLKFRYFATNSRVEVHYIDSVLKSEFNKEKSEKTKRYYPFEDTLIGQKVGRPYLFTPEDCGLDDKSLVSTDVTDVTDAVITYKPDF